MSSIAGPSRRHMELYRWLRSCAEKGERAPRNAEIADRFKFPTEAQASKMVAELERHRLIRVARFARSRVVMIVATKKFTAEDPKPVNEDAKPEGKTRCEMEREAKALVELPVKRFTVVDREPCRKCGVRAEIGCRHKPKSESWEIVL